MRVGLVQLSVSDQPSDNLEPTLLAIQRAHDGGARLVLTPEVTNFISVDRAHQKSVAQSQDFDVTLEAIRQTATQLGVWVSIGSLAIKLDEDDRLANRSFLIDPQGVIRASYDKLHMFDVEVSATESYRESSGYRPGSRASVVQTEWCDIGLTICYDLRFPLLYQRLALAGAKIILVPSAFSPVTGAAHWEPLLRARAIETGAYILASAQCGTHAASAGRARQTYGHSLAVSPWGEVLLDMGTSPGVGFVDLDLGEVDDARRRIPSLNHIRAFDGP